VSKPATLRVEPVTTRSGRREFIGVTRRVFAGDPCWVQPLTAERLEHLDARRNPFLREMEIRYWIARRGPLAVGRISAQVNRRHTEQHDSATGHFGFLDAVDEPDVFGALLACAESWLRGQGMRRIAGPFSLSVNDQCGLLVEGFEQPPNMMMGHARPYYAGRLEALGYVKEKDLIAYDYDVTAPWPPAAERLLAHVREGPDLRIRPFDMRRYGEEIATLCEIFNDAWSDNWGFVPFGVDEARYLAKTIRPLVNAHSFAVGEFEGEPAAMAVALPNLNEAIRGLDGRLLPLGWLRLLWRLKVRGLRTGRIPLMGVRKRLQGTAAGAALALGVIGAIRAYHQRHGYLRAELSWVLDDNRPARNLIETVGGVPYKRFRLYAKALGQ
jgi:hypothetical protein